MKRRHFLLYTGATLALPATATFAAVDFTPGLVQKHLAQGDTVFLDFKADWCATCAAQERVITALRQSDPAYDAHITFINVDWDRYSNSDLARRLNIPRRSTLVVLKGDAELGRIVAATSKSQIQELMDTALAAATA